MPLTSPAGTIEWEQAADGMRIALSGEIDFSCRDRLQAAYLAASATMPGNALIDASSVTFLSSEGLGFLARIANLVVEEHHGTVTLHNADGNTARVMEIFGIHKHIALTHD